MNLNNVIDDMRVRYYKESVGASIYDMYCGEEKEADLRDFFGLQYVDSVTMENIMCNKTIDEIFETINKLIGDHWTGHLECDYFYGIIIKLEKIKEIMGITNEKSNIESMAKEIAVIKDNVQNTADIVNLFTDIDKNRTSLEEQIKKVNDRLEEQDNKINNRIDKLEASIELIISMLQKS